MKSRQRRGKHTTVIEGPEQIWKILRRAGGVEVSPGKITTGLPVGRHLVKLRQLSGGVEMTYRATRTKQVFHLYGDGRRIENILREQAKV